MVEDFKENYTTGWIKLFRSVRNHWIWPKGKRLTYFEAWITILMEVNHENEKCLIDNEIIYCERGQKLYSLQSWAKIFNWSIQNVRTFFNLLEKDNMVICEGLRKTTRLTVCNYESYQNNQQATNTQLTSNQHTGNTQLTTIKELKNEKNYKEYIYSKFYDSEIEKSQGTKYTDFVKYLYGNNMLKTKLSGILSIRDQLTFTDFEKILDKCEVNKVKLGDVLTKIENDKKYYKGKTSLYRTLLNWIDGRFIK